MTARINRFRVEVRMREYKRSKFRRSGNMSKYVNRASFAFYGARKMGRCLGSCIICHGTPHSAVKKWSLCWGTCFAAFAFLEGALPEIH